MRERAGERAPGSEQRLAVGPVPRLAAVPVPLPAAPETGVAIRDWRALGAPAGSGCPGAAGRVARAAGPGGGRTVAAGPAAGWTARAPSDRAVAFRARPGTSEYVRAATSGSLPPVRSN